MITEQIDLEYRFKEYHHIQVSKDCRIFNVKTGREKKICRNCRSFGIWLTPKRFVTLSKINSLLEVKPKTLKDLLNEYR